MIPHNSNTSEASCTPISSNCVIWQGECMDCVNVNTGDTISDVMHSMVTELCLIKTKLSLTSLDLKCLYEQSALSPDPDKSLKNILSLLITKVCATPATITPITPVTDLVTVASCFQTTDINGDLITNLTQLNYLKAIGTRLCSIFSTVTAHTNSITNHESRIVVLENQTAVVPLLPTIIPACVIPGGTPQSLLSVLTAVETQFCSLRSITGTAGELSQAIGKQCVNLNSSPALGSSGIMSGISGWKSTVSTVADSMNNLWLTLCDMRAAIDAVKTCCSKTCNDVVVNFLANITDNGAKVNLYFSGYTFLPAGFVNCTTTGSKLTVTDGLSGVYVVFINLITQSANTAPYIIDIPSTPLSPTGTYTFTLESCVTDGTLTCNKTVIVKATGNSINCAAPSIVSVSLS